MEARLREVEHVRAQYVYDADNMENDVDEDDEEEMYQDAHTERLKVDVDEDYFGSESEGEGAGASGDTSFVQAARGRDIQGIPWDSLRRTRSEYRETRLSQYKNYENLNVSHEVLEKDCKKVETGGTFFQFYHNTRQVKPNYVHFQLRNLIWATSKHDVFVMSNSVINHWSPVSRKTTPVLDLGDQLIPYTRQKQPWLQGSGVRKVQISTMCARGNLVVAGGYNGEMVCKYLDRGGIAHCSRITHDENAITNAIEIFDAQSGAVRIVASNNDAVVRVFDAETFYAQSHFLFSWAVNHTSVSPDGKLMVVVGDDPQGLLVDSATGKKVATLNGHLDFSFASSWHPDGRVFATGNQDTTCRLWDARCLGGPSLLPPGCSSSSSSACLATLKGHIGAIRSLRFSSNGKFLAMAEPADFIHVFDAQADYSRCQEIDLFGELPGISFSPDSEVLYIGVTDFMYGSLLEYHLVKHNSHHLDYWI